MTLIKYNLIHNEELKGYDILFERNKKLYDDDYLQKTLYGYEICKTEKGFYFAALNSPTEEDFLDILREIKEEKNIIFKEDKTITLDDNYKVEMYYDIQEKEGDVIVQFTLKSFFDKYQKLEKNTFYLKLEHTLLKKNIKTVGLFEENLYSFKGYTNEEIKDLLESIPYFKFIFLEWLDIFSTLKDKKQQ